MVRFNYIQLHMLCHAHPLSGGMSCFKDKVYHVPTLLVTCAPLDVPI
jgi:hypothetical protein